MEGKHSIVSPGTARARERLLVTASDSLLIPRATGLYVQNSIFSIRQSRCFPSYCNAGVRVRAAVRTRTRNTKSTRALPRTTISLSKSGFIRSSRRMKASRLSVEDAAQLKQVFPRGRVRCHFRLFRASRPSHIRQLISRFTGFSV